MSYRDFDTRIIDAQGGPLSCRDITTLQVNMTLRCNQQCRHCHLSAGPDRSEHMDAETVSQVIEAVGRLETPVVDITGGAPELNENLPRLVEGARQQGCEVMLRTNLTVLREDMELARFLADNEVKLVASLPCYMRKNVEEQRGSGVYDRSVEMLRALNEIGYGEDSSLILDLVYNPAGPFLPPAQAELEEAYREELRERFNITFDGLLTITNMPLGRFKDALERDGELAEYRDSLRDGFNPETVPGLMCQHQVSVGPDGTLYDCDFNLAEGLPVDAAGSAHVSELEYGALIGRPVVTGDHCFACTAGAGSSCQGALV